MTGRIWAFAVYSICYEFMVWFGWFWVVFILDQSALWTILAVVLSQSQLRMSSFDPMPKQESEASS